jgi:acyl-CoA thioesterase-1
MAGAGFEGSFMRLHRSRFLTYGEKNGWVQKLAAFWVTIACVLTLTFAPAPAQAADKPVKIVVLGDSLSAGFGLPVQSAFPTKLAAALKAKGIAAEIANAGVSGDTASGGLARLDWSVPDGTDAVILELGANDALRGIDPKVTQTALDGILSKLKARHIAALLAGMLAPPNMGADYGRDFNAIYPALAKSYDAVYYPFFLDGVAADPKLNQGDGMHPNAGGVDAIVARMMPKVEELIARVRAARGS